MAKSILEINSEFANQTGAVIAFVDFVKANRPNIGEALELQFMYYMKQQKAKKDEEVRLAKLNKFKKDD